MIVIVDFGMGNLRSVQKSFERLKIKAITSSSVAEIETAEKLILPGVGNFTQGMKNLKKLNLINVLQEKVVNKKTPVLGICLGMQLVTKYSEEGDCEGLGWINEAYTKYFRSKKMDVTFKIPHMGWNTISIKQSHSLFNGHNPNDPFYFVHSYYVNSKNGEYILATTNYSFEFASVIQKENVFGTQFHPEKSHKQGLNILKNFTEFSNV